MSKDSNDINQLKNRIEQQQSCINDYEQQIKELKKKISTQDDMESSLVQVKKLEKKSKVDEGVVRQLLSEIDHNNRKIGSQEQELQHKESRIKSMGKKYNINEKNLKKTIRKLKKEIKDMKMWVKEKAVKDDKNGDIKLKERVWKKEKEVEDLKKENEKIKKEREVEIKQLKKEIEKEKKIFKNEKKVFEEEKKKFGIELDKEKKRVNEFKFKFLDKSGMVEKLKVSIKKKKDGVDKQIQSLIGEKYQEILEKTEINQQLKRENTKLQKELIEEKQKSKDEQKKDEILDKVKGEKIVLQNEKKILVIEKKKLKDELKKKGDELIKVQEEKKGIEVERSVLQVEKKKLKAELKKKGEEIIKIQEEEKEIQHEKGIISGKYDNLLEEKKVLIIKIKDDGFKYENVKYERDVYREKVQDLQKNIKKKIGGKIDYDQAFMECEYKMKELNIENEKLKSEWELVNKEFKELKSDWDQLGDKINNFRVEQELFLNKNITEFTINELKEEIERLRKVVEGLRFEKEFVTKIPEEKVWLRCFCNEAGEQEGFTMYARPHRGYCDCGSNKHINVNPKFVDKKQDK